eukprot:1518911-Rhodomonas_salina.1
MSNDIAAIMAARRSAVDAATLGDDEYLDCQPLWYGDPIYVSIAANCGAAFGGKKWGGRANTALACSLREGCCGLLDLVMDTFSEPLASFALALAFPPSLSTHTSLPPCPRRCRRAESTSKLWKRQPKGAQGKRQLMPTLLLHEDQSLYAPSCPSLSARPPSLPCRSVRYLNKKERAARAARTEHAPTLDSTGDGHKGGREGGRGDRRMGKGERVGRGR